MIVAEASEKKGTGAVSLLSNYTGCEGFNTVLDLMFTVTLRGRYYCYYLESPDLDNKLENSQLHLNFRLKTNNFKI